MEEMTREEANKIISNLTAEAYAKLEEATVLADKFGLYVDFDLTYGAGATYHDGGWNASSQSC